MAREEMAREGTERRRLLGNPAFFTLDLAKRNGKGTV